MQSHVQTGWGLRRAALIAAPVLAVAITFLAANSASTELRAQVPPKQAPQSAPQAAAQLAVRPLPEGTFTVVGRPAPVSGPVPVQSLVAFETAFTQQLNSAIRNPQALTAGRPKVVVLVDHSVWRDIVADRALVVVASAATVTLSHAQLQDLRDLFTRQVDAAVQAELAGRPGAKPLGYGSLQPDSTFNLKISPVAAN